MKKILILLLTLSLFSCKKSIEKHNFYSEGDEVCFVSEPSKKGVVVFVKKSGATYKVSYFDIKGKNTEDVFAAYELCDCN